jgi:hypothetical protein
MDPLEAVRHLAGLQAQTTSTWYTGMWGRLAGFDPVALSTHLEARRVVRLSVMRGTIHLLTGDDALAFRPQVQVVHDRMLQGSFGRQLAGIDIDRVADAGRRMVDEEPLTFDELGRRLQLLWPGGDRLALAMAVRARHALVQVPPRGLWRRSGLARHTSAENWLGRPLSRSVGAEMLVLRYLAAFGPASVMDAQAWSGLTRLKAVVDMLRPRLVTFEDEQGRELVDLPDAPRPGPEVEVPVRLLYDYDNLFLAYADRSRFLPAGLDLALPAGPGAHYGMVLVDGMVGGWWQHVRHPGRSTVVVHPRRAVARGLIRQLEAEGTSLARFLGPDDADPTVDVDTSR